MLKHLSDTYSDQRTPVDSGILYNFLIEILRMSAKITLPEDTCHKVVLLFLSSIGYYFYLHPEQYVDFGRFVAYRSTDLKNLWTIESKEYEDASTIYDYFKNGGLETEEMKRLVKQFAQGLYQDSTTRLSKLDKDIKFMDNLVSQDKGQLQNNKETENGI